MKTVTIPKSSIDFLNKIKKNNNRDWFNAHKDLYLIEHGHLIAFADALLAEMNKHDHIETATGKKSLYRIYKDTRFSKDKTPYKINWSGGFKRATKKLRGGYYFHIEAGNSFVGGGFWGPSTDDLKRIRQEFDYDAAPLRKILKSKQFINTFGQLHGEQLTTSPQGYHSTHPNIDLLRYKQFIIYKKFSDKEVLSPQFLKNVNETFKQMRPFFNYMSEVLTTDTNGISLV